MPLTPVLHSILITSTPISEVCLDIIYAYYLDVKQACLMSPPRLQSILVHSDTDFRNQCFHYACVHNLPDLADRLCQTYPISLGLIASDPNRKVEPHFVTLEQMGSLVPISDPLLEAVRGSYLSIVQLITTKFSNPTRIWVNSKLTTDLFRKAIRSQAKIIDLLLVWLQPTLGTLSSGSVWPELIHYLAAYGQTEIMQSVLTYFGPLNLSSMGLDENILISLACEHNSLDMVKCLLTYCKDLPTCLTPQIYPEIQFAARSNSDLRVMSQLRLSYETLQAARCIRS